MLGRDRHLARQRRRGPRAARLGLFTQALAPLAVPAARVVPSFDPVEDGDGEVLAAGPAVLVEELVWNDRAGDWVAAPREVVDEAPWRATYEVELRFSRGRHLIEIKFVSPEPDVVCSIVLSNWVVRVR